MFDSDENFVEIGTALEPLEEEEVPKKKPVNISDQIVVDEKGRRRFHGAFTGGFSAGYFNTVGSKEGWEPSTFKSTRNDRFSKKNQNVQDFMDEEDLGAFGIAPQILRPTEDFDKKGNRKRTKATPSEGPIPGEPVLDWIIKPVRDTVGMRILQRMGWRPGQGVGPRTHRTKQGKAKLKGKKSNFKEDLTTSLENASIESIDLTSKVYGCLLPPGALRRNSEDDDSTDSEFENLGTDVMFAPEDLESPLCNPKENTYGLGYKGLDRNALAFGHGHIDLFGSELKFRVENKKMNIKGEAFGVGAFEDDDEEVYSREDISQYDFALETLEERKARLSNEKMMKKTRKEYDGAIAGFTRAKRPPAQRKYFPPPSLPKDFEPIHLKRKSRFEAIPESKDIQAQQARKQGLERHNLTVGERQVLIGEVIERISSDRSQTERDEIVEESKAPNNDQLHMAHEKSERLKRFAEVLQEYSSNKIHQVDSLGRPSFKPFMKNPEKQDRYEKYMTLVAAGYKECLKDLQPLDMTEWQREREKMEFDRASALYKPINEVMSSRFVSAQSHDISHVVPIKEVAKVKDPTQDPKVAAKMNLFGKLTHQILEWHPDRLLCKRLNVPHPYPDSKMVGVRNLPTALGSVPTTLSEIPNIKPTHSDVQAAPLEVAPLTVKKSLFENLDFSKPPPGLLPALQFSTYNSNEPPPPGTENEPISSPMQIESTSNLQILEDQLSPLVSTTNIRPSIDLFKEIFADTSSESEDEAPAYIPLARFPVSTSSISTRTSNSDIPKSNKEFEKTSANQNKNTDGGKTSSQINHSFVQKEFYNSSIEPSLKLSSNHKESVEIKRKGNENNVLDLESEEDEEYIYGPKPPTTQAKESMIPISSKISTFLNPMIRTTQNNAEDEVEWVEKGKDSFSSKESNKSSSSHNHHHKSKKSKEKQKSKHKSSKKQKSKSKSKHRKKKSKSRTHSLNNKDSDSEDENTDSSSSTSPVQIHHSRRNKALLLKLKELTRSN